MRLFALLLSALLLSWPGGALADGCAMEALLPCEGAISPGARVEAANGSCTLGFVLRDAEGALYLTTAGHCTDGVGDTLDVPGAGDAVASIVFDGLPAWPGHAPLDFAVARVDAAFSVRVDPMVCRWGGPLPLRAPRDGETVRVCGAGALYGETTPTRGRPGAVLFSNAAEFRYAGFAQSGDSGAPVLGEDGAALGLHVRSLFSAAGVRPDPGVKTAVRLDEALRAAREATGLELELVTGGAFDPLGR